jgi:hypothetical protein
MAVCARVIKKESKQEWKYPYVSIVRGMKSSPNARLA